MFPQQRHCPLRAHDQTAEALKAWGPNGAKDRDKASALKFIKKALIPYDLIADIAKTRVGRLSRSHRRSSPGP